MTEKILVKAYIPDTLYRSLLRECKACGCTQSAIISMAILDKVRDMAARRRSEPSQLDGQLKLPIEGINASDHAQSEQTAE